jgi:hypothetical protein
MNVSSKTRSVAELKKMSRAASFKYVFHILLLTSKILGTRESDENSKIQI